MKIQCDVCEKGEAAVYCTADEAALCSSCDHRVHHANKLAGKHHRFALIHPPPKQAPLCDICQERRAFLFCQQDRAILCRECDIPIHKANPHTEKHSRFLLTGVKLSPTAVVYPATSSPPIPESNVSDAVPCFSTKKAAPVSANPGDPKTLSSSPAYFNSSVTVEHEKNTSSSNNGDANGSPTSSISEYLIEMLPGWHVEELLDSSSPFGFSKSTNNNDVMPFWDGGLDSRNLTFSSSESAGLWVPQAPPPPVNPSQNQWFPTNSNNICFGGQDQAGAKESRKWNDDNVFAVPQISPHANMSKRQRTLW